MAQGEFKEIHSVVIADFDHVVMGYIRNDLEQMMRIGPATPDGLGWCAVPLALTVFAGMNFLGELLRRPWDAPTDTTASIEKFCTDFMKKVNCEVYGKETTQELFTELFRHGIVHQFLPKRCDIMRDPSFQRVLQLSPTGRIVLQAEILARDFLTAIELMGAKVKRGTNEAFLTALHRRREHFLDKDASAFEALRAKIERNLTLAPAPLSHVGMGTSGNKSWRTSTSTSTTVSSTTTTAAGEIARSMTTTDPRFIKEDLQDDSEE